MLSWTEMTVDVYCKERDLGRSDVSPLGPVQAVQSVNGPFENSKRSHLAYAVIHKIRTLTRVYETGQT